MENIDNKITIRLVLPMSGVSHDIRLPADITIRDTVPTIMKMLNEIHEEDLLLSDAHLLCRSATGDVLGRMEETLQECGVRDSDVLFLV